jgi:hypothetical protein
MTSDEITGTTKEIIIVTEIEITTVTEIRNMKKGEIETTKIGQKIGVDLGVVGEVDLMIIGEGAEEEEKVLTIEGAEEGSQIEVVLREGDLEIEKTLISQEGNSEIEITLISQGRLKKLQGMTDKTAGEKRPGIMNDKVAEVGFLIQH